MQNVVKRPTKPQKLTIQRKAEIFKALGHPTRLQIVEKLADGELCVCHILEMFDVDMSTLSRHLSVRKNGGAVVDERRGKSILYTLKCPCLMDMIECMENVLIER
jgi:ArsR family transcriptional regulator